MNKNFKNINLQTLSHLIALISKLALILSELHYHIYKVSPGYINDDSTTYEVEMYNFESLLIRVNNYLTSGKYGLDEIYYILQKFNISCKRNHEMVDMYTPDQNMMNILHTSLSVLEQILYSPVATSPFSSTVQPRVQVDSRQKSN